MLQKNQNVTDMMPVITTEIQLTWLNYKFLNEEQDITESVSMETSNFFYKKQLKIEKNYSVSIFIYFNM